MAPLTLALALATGCTPGPIAAEYGSELIIDETEQTFSLDAAYTAPGDGIGLLIMNSVRVLDPDGVPAQGIAVDVVSGWGGAYIIAEGAVRVVADYEVSCDGSEDETCDAFFDNGNQQYVEFAGEYTEVEDFRPTYFSGVTDNFGLMTFYTFIDSVPSDGEEGTGSISMYVDIRVDTETITYSFN